MEEITASGESPGVRFPGERPAAGFVAYESFEAYVAACTAAANGAADLPVYMGPPPAASDCQSLAAHLTHFPQTRNESASTVMLSEKGSPAAVCASLLASRTGARLLLVENLAEYYVEDHAEEDRPTCVIALAETIGDSLLTGALRRMTRPCRDRRPWNGRSGDCFVTAGDLVGLSHYVARLIAAAWQEPGSDSFHMITSDSGCTEYRTLQLGDAPRARVQELAPDAVGPAIAEAEGVVAFYGHGGDACAYAGGVTVLCGRRAHALALALDGGTLACRDEGAGCPRGPLPMPMATLRAQHVMQTSCSSTRLADSALTPAFNLLLSFVDGAGLSHVGMAMAGGRLECCVLYLAAMADGKTLGETLTLMNCFLDLAGLDQAVYVGLGLPELRARGRRSADDAGHAGEPQIPVPGTGGEFSCDFGACNFGTFLLSDPGLVGLAGSGRLAFALEVPTEAMWFCRLEESTAEGDSSLRLRVFVFSFPSPLGSVRFLPFDSMERTQLLHAKLGSLRRWTDYHRLIAGAESEGATAGAAACNSFQDKLPAILDRLRSHAKAVRALETVAASLDHTRVLLRDLLLAELAPQLSGPFWLTNVLRRDQYFVSADPGQCPACGGQSFRRRMGHHLSDERRSVHVCTRCGIVDDFRIDSGFVQVLVSCPATVERGGSLYVLVQVHCAPQLRECFVLAGLSGPYSPKLETQILQADVLDGVAEVSFLFEIPHTMPLHEFRWKCVVADEHDLAFVARNVFVVDKASPARDLRPA